MQIKERLIKLKDWTLKNEAIEKKYEFQNFTEAIAFIVKVAFHAEKEKHHPQIEINYNKVTLRLSTHEVNEITEKDFKLAALIDELS